MNPIPTVLVTQEENILVITIDRPAVRNAIDHRTSQALADAMDRLDNDPTVAVGILTGAGGHFCSGMDLKAFVNGERVELPGRGLGGMIETPPLKPIIAAVEGYALAGGFEIALACDLLVASENAVFGLPEVKRGLIAGSGGLIRLPQKIPRQIAMQYALTGDLMTASDARQWGLVNELTSAGQALAAAKVWAQKIAANGPVAVKMAKHVMSQSVYWSIDELWTKQNQVLETVIQSQDAREGAMAFNEKRTPVWAGR
ncbi:MAG: crotonase/enoyl-CoA hydratase family protein [Limnohabitans sp.]|nr:crotonase/enoyl-CoA hydratase family protein [Burkholderiales bacterium]